MISGAFYSKGWLWGGGGLSLFRVGSGCLFKGAGWLAGLLPSFLLFVSSWLACWLAMEIEKHNGEIGKTCKIGYP